MTLGKVEKYYLLQVVQDFHCKASLSEGIRLIMLQVRWDEKGTRTIALKSFSVRSYLFLG